MRKNVGPCAQFVNRGSAFFARELLPLGEELQRVERCESVDVQRLQLASELGCVEDCARLYG